MAALDLSLPDTGGDSCLIDIPAERREGGREGGRGGRERERNVCKTHSSMALICMCMCIQ